MAVAPHFRQLIGITAFHKIVTRFYLQVLAKLLLGNNLQLFLRNCL
jgi:hypothetical protein